MRFSPVVPELRRKFNSEFTPERYKAFLKEVNTATYYPAGFRISETPIFLSKELTDELVKASYEIVDQLQTKEFKEHSSHAIPSGTEVPNEDDHATFLQIDFALCHDDRGNVVPQLIELQGFPSLYCYQHLVERMARQYFSIPDELTTYFNGMTADSYVRHLKRLIVGTGAPENVVLLEIEPEQQKTRIDFACTHDLLGVRPVCVTKILKRGKKLFYAEDGKEIPIDRIYNRVIFDELQKKNLELNFKFTEELDVKWVGHPNWFFKISKFSLPFIRSDYAPPSYFLHELTQYPADLSEYVLKPLYSFAGSGVCIEVTKEMLDSIGNKQAYILQKKVDYAPLIETPDGYAKAEIRMMFVWEDSPDVRAGKPLLINNLVRMSKGKMMGVAFNKDKTWVGSSLAYHP